MNENDVKTQAENLEAAADETASKVEEKASAAEAEMESAVSEPAMEAAVSKETAKGTKVMKAIIYGVLFGVITGVLWAYLNPITIVPGLVQLRLFSFIPPVIGVIFGPVAGLASGYIGSIVWAILSGTFSPIDTLIGSSIFVALTGFIPAFFVTRKKTLAEIGYEKGIVWKLLIWTVVAAAVDVVGSGGVFALLGFMDFPMGMFVIAIGDAPCMILAPFISVFLARKLKNFETSLPRF